MQRNKLQRLFVWSRTNKKTSIAVVILVLIIAYFIYNAVSGSSSTPQYTLATARMGNIAQTISQSGQVSASNQTDIQSQVSGTIKSIYVSVGQNVKAGDLIATIDNSNALISLENARISLAKLTVPAKEADVEIAKNNLAKAYDSGFNAVSQVFLNLPSILSGSKDLLYSQTGYLSDQSSTYLSGSGRTYRDTAGKTYDSAYNKYQSTLMLFKGLNRSSPTADLDKLLAETYETIKAVSESVTHAQNAINYIITVQPEYQASAADTALTNVTTWANQANSDVSSIVSAQNSILSSKNSLDNLIDGSDALDIQSARLSLEQAQRSYDNYFIRAPYDGIIGRIPVNVYGQSGSGTTIATIVGTQKIVTLSLNEIDASKVQIGQRVDIDFDAIDGLNATGTVSVVDQVGTLSSGVVSYGVKININTNDERIKPGMSVNASIVTLEKNGVLVVPSNSIKKSGNEYYVQSLDQSTVQASLPKISTSTNARNPRLSASNSTSTARMPIASTTRPNGSPAMQNLTISTNEAPARIIVTTGVSDDTNTEILSGLSRGQFIITKTSANSTAQTTNAPSLFSQFGSRPPGTGGTSGAIRATNVAR
jgi:HlyD family secretion protein